MKQSKKHIAVHHLTKFNQNLEVGNGLTYATCKCTNKNKNQKCWQLKTERTTYKETVRLPVEKGHRSTDSTDEKQKTHR